MLWITQSDDEVWPDLSADEMNRVRIFLLTRHRPTSVPSEPEPVSVPARAVAAPIPARQTQKAGSHTCKHCRSEKLNIAHGKFGYYFKCTACDKTHLFSSNVRNVTKKLEYEKLDPHLQKNVRTAVIVHYSTQIADELRKSVRSVSGTYIPAAITRFVRFGELSIRTLLFKDTPKTSSIRLARSTVTP